MLNGILYLTCIGLRKTTRVFLSAISFLCVQDKHQSRTSIFTARIRRMTEGNIFSLLTLAEGGGGPEYPPSHVRTWGGPPSCWSRGGGGYPIPGQDGATPILLITCGGGYPYPRWGQGVPPNPGPRSGWGWVPHPKSGQGVTPPPRHPGQDHHCVYLLRGGRYASYFHTGGLSFITHEYSTFTQSWSFFKQTLRQKATRFLTLAATNHWKCLTYPSLVTTGRTKICTGTWDLCAYGLAHTTKMVRNGVF